MPRINLGSGFNPLNGFDNCDINESCPNLSFVCDLTEIPKEDGYYDEAWSIHTIEHFSIPNAKKALLEWYRILKPGGMLHVDTPNLERNVGLYLHGDWMRDFNTLLPIEQEALMLNGQPNKTLWVNFKMFSTPTQFDTHFWNADEELLQALCIEAGFARTEVFQRDPSLIVRAYK
jgi:predicted SAM-dependent methyltransferase